MSASVAGHEVGVSAHQHAHHLGTETRPHVRDKWQSLEETGPLVTLRKITVNRKFQSPREEMLQ